MDLLVRCSYRRIYFIHHNPVRPSIQLIPSFLHKVYVTQLAHVNVNNTPQCIELYIKFKITSVTYLNSEFIKLLLIIANLC